MQKNSLNSIKDLGLCLQTLIHNRYRKNVRPIYTKGRYNSMFISFYKQYNWQFYVQDKNGYYLVYLLKDDRVIKKDIIIHGELISKFYSKIMYFFRFI